MDQYTHIRWLLQTNQGDWISAKREINSIRITIKPVNYKEDVPDTPALEEQKYPALRLVFVR